MSYETLDRIADAYIPILAIVYLLYMIYSASKRKWKDVGNLVFIFLLGMIVAYGFMITDNHFKIAEKFSLDYSTHTAVSLVLVLMLTLKLNRYKWMWILSFVGYALLMLYQRYHTILDILITGILVGSFYWGGLFIFYEKLTKRSSQQIKP